LALDRYRDPEEAVDERVKDLLGRMSLEEKLAQIASVDETAEPVALNADEFGSGIGHVVSDPQQQPVAAARRHNEIQEWLQQNTRLGIPALFHAELDALGAPLFPQGIGLAASFAPAQVRAMAAQQRTGFRAIGARLAYAPGLDIGRDPRWRHVATSCGEDPYLAGRIGVACVRGLQGEALVEGVAAAGNHFVGYGLAVGGMDQAPVHLGRRQLREVFAEPFAAAIRDADLACVVSGRNSIDGLPTSASRLLLTELLRDDLGFDGLVVSDANALENLISDHGVAENEARAAAMALTAGLDVELPRARCFAQPLQEQLESQSVDISVLNRAVRRVLRLKFRLGLFEAPLLENPDSTAAFATPARQDLARSLAQQSMVLLKNTDGVLPLTATGRIAVVGPATFGDSADAVSPQAGIMGRAGDTATISVCCGGELRGSDPAAIAEAVGVAANSDVTIVLLGGTSGDFADAGRLELPRGQLALLAELRDVAKKLVCVLAGGRTYALESVVPLVDALLLAWQPGAQGGAALADLLFGDTSPSGRLPVSLVRHVGQVPAYYNRKAGAVTQQSNEPLYSFGYGLSYCGFEYTELQCPESVDTNGVLRIAFELFNSGGVDADEVVQIYGRDLVASVTRPVRALIGFNRVSVPAGESLTCKFRIDLSQFAYFDEAMQLAVEPGDIELMIGGGSQDIRLSQTVRLTGEARVLSQRQIVATQATSP